MSASTMPTECPSAARATARLVVTVDLPTPPLPDDTRSGRVFEPAWANRTARTSACPCAWPCPAVAPGSPCRRLTKLLAVGVGHHGELEIDAGHAVERSDRLGDTLRGDLVAQRASGDREGDQDPDPAVVVQVDVAEHPEFDDRSVQLRVLDRTERIDDLLRASSTWRPLCRGHWPNLQVPGGRIGSWPVVRRSPPPCQQCTDAFGDRTRRRIYLYVRDHVCDDGVTASMVATEVGVHPNVARHHLDKLAAGGYSR